MTIIAKVDAICPDLKRALVSLNAQNPFMDFNLGLSESEKHQFNRIVVEPCDCYNNYGNLRGLVVDLTIFFESMGNDYDSSYVVAKSIHKIVQKIVRDLRAESFWLTMRIPNKSNLFDVPRWHQDGYYYSPFRGFMYKIALTLKGPTTLFYNISSQDRKKFDEIFDRKIEYKDENGQLQRESYGDTIEGRKELDKDIDHSKVHQPKLYTGTVFIVGDNAAVHSEPPIHSDRIFISIVPGSKKQIQELQNKHHNKEYIKVISTTYK